MSWAPYVWPAAPASSAQYAPCRTSQSSNHPFSGFQSIGWSSYRGSPSSTGLGGTRRRSASTIR